jgi:gliding motility-associated-like protein
VAGGLAPGTYNVTVTDQAQCDTVLSPTVYAYSTISSLLATPTGIYIGQTVELTVQTSVPVTGVHWSPYVQGSVGQSDVYDKPQQTTQYTVIVDYGQGCQLFDTTTVTVLQDTTRMVVPNVFTPNGDGINDYFLILASPATLNTFHMWIYDRWGNKVYETTDINFNWDGTDVFAGNKPLHTGVFSYAIEYTLYNVPDKKEIGGNISLVK